ncbi:MAG: TrkH family potassium uptake protein [Gemmatimonadota bacterium]|nr:MAG: TrkH family potassium uptake protein [Gemmatimonadota bacterium]
MNAREVLHIVGALLIWTAVAMVPPAVLSFFEGLAVHWTLAVSVTAAIGCVLWFLTPHEVSINRREGIAIVGLGWLAVVAVGSLPFQLTGVTPTVASALFESASGFTTTGATVFAVIEDLPRSILLWRSITHWMGGMGIIVLGVAILPLIGMGGAQLFRAEVPGIAADRLKPRVATTARLLWGVYALLTATLAVIYLVLGMSLFDAVNHAMSALATGGFSTRTTSVGAFSPAIQWVTIVFMLAAGTNFTLHYQALTGRWLPWLRDSEFRWYAGVTLAAAAAVFLYLGFSGAGWAFRSAAFNVAAIATTTGFVTADFGAWPAFCQVLLLGLMFVGAMGGSTGGGFKTARAVVVLKHAVGEVHKVLHPRAVFVTKLGNAPIRSEILANVLAFLALYVATHGIGSLLIAALGYDLLTSVSAALAAMSSIGPGLGDVGPASHYGDLSAPAHIILSGLMLLGRLEFYTLLVLVIPGTWDRWEGGR